MTDDIIKLEGDIRLLPIPSVFNGEQPFLTFTVHPDDGSESIDVGKLWGTGGKLSFEGDVEESAKIFFEHVVEINRHLLEPDS